MKAWFPSLLSACVILGGVAVCGAPAVTAQSATLRWQVFSQPVHRPALIYPGGIALDAAGNLYVADTGHDQVQKLSPWGARLAVFGTIGWRPGHFRDPIRVGVDRHGNIYVDDAGNNRVQKLSPAGKVLAAFDLQPFSYAIDMAVSPAGDVYVSYFDRIMRLSPGGRRAIWFRHGGPLAVDRSGNLYTVSYSEYDPTTRRYSSSIYELSPGGVALARWTIDNVYPQRIAVDAAGYIYLFAGYPSIIEKLSPSGSLAQRIPVPRGQYYGQGNSMVVTAAGDILLTDSGQQRIDVLSPSGSLVATRGGQGNTMGRLRLPEGVAVDRRGFVYVADTWHDRVQKFAPDGRAVQEWGTSGRGPRQFNRPTDVLVDRQGNIVVADFGNSRLQVFTPSGRLLRIVRLPGPHYVYGYGPYPGYYGAQQLSIAQDAQGNYLIADPALHRVAKISPAGRILAAYFEWITARSSAPGGIAVDAAGNIYIADAGAARIVKLSTQGHRIAVWGRFGYVRPGDFNRPSGIALDAAGNIYVSDVGNHRIQEFWPDGRPMHAWGMLGAGHAQFAFPQGLAVAPSGTLFVADTWNNRIQRLGR